MVVFIDEAGDSGMKNKPGSSKYFVISLVVFPDKEEAKNGVYQKTKSTYTDLAKKKNLITYPHKAARRRRSSQFGYQAMHYYTTKPYVDVNICG